MELNSIVQKYKDHDPYWPLEILVVLDGKTKGLGLRWAASCMDVLLGNVPTTDPDVKNGIRVLMEACRTGSVDGDPMVMSKLIWHKKRDIIHTALAHLFAALAHLHKEDMSSYRRSVNSGMSVMSNHSCYRESAIAEPLALYENMCKE